MFKIAITLILTLLSGTLLASPDKALVFIECVDANGSQLSTGTGAIISELGEVLTAKHVIEEAKSTSGGKCFGKVESRFVGAASELDISGPTENDAAIVKFRGNIDPQRILSYCNSRKYRAAKSYKGEFSIYGFPLKADLNRWSARIQSFNGPRQTWYVDASFIEGFSGGPVLDSDDNIIAIALGGPTFETAGFRNILPEQVFRNKLLEGRANKCDSWSEPLTNVLTNSQLTKLNQSGVFFGQTEPGVGFVEYRSDGVTHGWAVTVNYPEHIRDSLIAMDRPPVIMTSLGGSGSHWLSVGSTAVYNSKSVAGNIEIPGHKNGSFVIFIKPGGALARLGDNKSETNTLSEGEKKLPIGGKWYINYAIFFNREF